jgi:hypothetical protein
MLAISRVRMTSIAMVLMLATGYLVCASPALADSELSVADMTVVLGGCTGYKGYDIRPCDMNGQECQDDGDCQSGT